MNKPLGYNPGDPSTIPAESKIDPKTGANLAPGMVSMEDVIKIQEQLEKGITPVIAPKEDEVPKEDAITEEEITALKEKAEKSPDELSEDEKAFLAELEAAQQEPPAGNEDEPKEDEKIITIGGVQKRESEVVAEMEEEFGVDTSQLPPENLQKMLNTFLDSKNKGAWQKSLTQNSQAVATQRKEAQQMLDQVNVQRIRTEEALADIAGKIKQLEKYAASDVTEADAIDSPIKQREFNKKLDAEEQLPELRKQHEELEDKASQYANSQKVAEITLFQSANPQYLTSEKFAEVLQKFDEGTLPEDSPDADRILDLVSVARHAQTIGKSLEVAYKDLAKMGQLRVKPASQNKPPIPKPKSPIGETFAEKLAKRQKNPTNFLSGSGGKPAIKASAPKKAAGDLVREATSRALGTQGSKAIDEIGY